MLWEMRGRLWNYESWKWVHVYVRNETVLFMVVRGGFCVVVFRGGGVPITDMFNFGVEFKTTSQLPQVFL